MSRPRSVTLVLAGQLLAAASVGAASIVPPRDLGQLARGSDAVVLAVALDSTPVGQGRIVVTRTDFAVERSVSGGLYPGDPLVVEVPGGEVEGRGLLVPGAPSFEAGRSYLLFLRARANGTWHPSLLSYGVLEAVRGRNGAALLRPLDEAGRIATYPRQDGSAAEAPGTYYVDGLVGHLEAVADGREAWTPARVLAAEADLPLDAQATSPPSGCDFMASPPARWTAFDSGGSIGMVADSTGDASLAGGGFSQVQSALGMWDGLSGTTLSLAYGGPVSYTLSCSGGFDAPDSDLVVFNDPCDDIDDLNGCSGILAEGGIYYSGSHAGPDNATWTTITGWFVLINNGAGCIGPTNYVLMLAHEMGHGLGFGHHSDSGALMYYMCCHPINETDVTCAQYAYPTSSPTPPSTPANVQASDGTYTDRIRVSWSSASGATSYEVFSAASDAPGEASSLGSTSATTFDDTSVAPGTTYWYWVNASNTYGTSDLSASDSGFAVVCEAPATPAASAPASAASGSPYAVSWTATSPDNSYDVQEATASSFAGAATYVTSGTARNFSHTVGGDTTYYYRIRARDACGGSLHTSDWSDPVQVVVQLTCSAPATPGIAAPASAQSGATYAVSWSGTSPDAAYDLQEATDPAFAGATTLQVSGTSRAFNHAVAGPTTYYYRVRARWLCGGATYTSDYSSAVATVVSPSCSAPGAVALDQPADGAVLASGSSSVVLTWLPAAGAGSYDLFFGQASPPPPHAGGLGGTAMVMPVSPGMTYFWRVVAHAACDPGLATASVIRSFSVPAQVPPPVAAFSYSPPAPLEGQAVQFTDTSNGSATAWSWTFGDGGSSGARHPVHTFASPGAYQVTLAASNAGGSSQATRTVTVAAVTRPETVPVVAHVAGFGTSAWRSDVAVTNPSDATLPIDIVFKASGGDQSAPQRIDLAPRESLWLPDVMAGLLGLGDGRGSLTVVPPQAGPRPAVFSRTYSVATSGNLGQGIPAVLPVAPGTSHVTGLFHDAASRTNLGVTAGDGGAQATFQLRTASGAVIATAGPIDLVARDQQQWPLTTLFPGLSGATAPLTVRVTVTGTAVPYASVVDQSSLDSVFLMAQTPASEWLVPIAAHNPGQDGTFWRTDLDLHNPGAGTVSVTAEYLPATTDNRPNGPTAAVATLAPGASARVADLLGTLFGVTNGKGAVRLSAGGGSFVASSRTSTTRTAGGTLGQGVPAIPVAGVSAARRTLAGVRVDATTRTNLGLASLANGATADLVLRDADGTVLGVRQGFWIPPRSVVQLSFADAFPGAAPPDPVGSIEVVPYAPLVAYLSIVDGTSQDPSFVAVP